MTSTQHRDEPAHAHNEGWLLSRTGLVTLGALAIMGFLVYTGHSAHLLGFLPYVLILACPLMHIFMHGGHHHHHHDARDDDGGSSHNEAARTSAEKNDGPQ
jgi:hypothetical protein